MLQFLKNIKQYLFPPELKTRVATWQTIQSGVLKDSAIFINEQSEIFKEMISGDYDAFFWNYINPSAYQGSTIIDIGAHIGYHTMAFAKIVGGKGHVLAFEPNKFNLERINLHLSKNIQLKPVVQLHNIALSDYNGETEFTFSGNIENETSSGGFIEGSDKPLEDETYRRLGFIKDTVDVRKLDDIISTSGLDNIKLMKIDVEGAEASVLRGALQTLNQHHPSLLIEIHSVYCMKDVMDVLQPLNYQIKIVKEEGPSRCFITAIYQPGLTAVI